MRKKSHRLNLPGYNWHKSQRKFYDLVNAQITKQKAEYRPTTWEMLADSVSAMQDRRRRDEELALREALLEPMESIVESEPVNVIEPTTTPLPGAVECKSHATVG